MTRIRIPFLLLFCFPLKTLSELDNELIGTPNIKCNADTIEMIFKTKRKFTGKVYVQGHYNTPDCRVDYSTQNTKGNPVGGIRIHHGSCDMDRQRMIQPEGMKFSSVLMISFHPLFVTKADRAFHVNCVYREVVNQVAADIEVSDPPSQQADNDMQMPTCKYTIRKDELDGDLLKYAQVGDTVVHRWECDSTGYGMLVHNCYVEDGQGEKRQVIDERGCHVDLVLGDPTYTKDLNMAYRESSVFKFADKVGVRFFCEIKLCLREDDGCAGITPPICGNEIAESFQDDHMNENWEIHENDTSLDLVKRHRRNIKKAMDLNTVSTDLISQYFYVLEDAGTPEELSKLLPEKMSQSSKTVCFNSTVFGLLSFFIIIIMSMFVILIVHGHVKQKRAELCPMEPPRRTSMIYG